LGVQGVALRSIEFPSGVVYRSNVIDRALR
jgi:hypothetical protein